MRWGIKVLCAAMALAATGATAVVLDRLYPLDLSRLAATSAVIEDRDGRMLRAFMTPDRQWRPRQAGATGGPAS